MYQRVRWPGEVVLAGVGLVAMPGRGRTRLVAALMVPGRREGGTGTLRADALPAGSLMLGVVIEVGVNRKM